MCNNSGTELNRGMERRSIVVLDDRILLIEVGRCNNSGVGDSFFQFERDEESAKLYTFWTTKGLYQFKARGKLGKRRES